MAWNGSNGAGHAPGKSTLPIAISGISKVLMVSAVVIATASGSIYYIFHTTKKAAPSRTGYPKHGKIALVTPATNSPPKESKSKPKRPYKELSSEEKLEYFQDKYGANLPDNLKPLVYYLKNPPQVSYKSKTDETAIFKFRSEREIAAFLLMEPGTWMIRRVAFNDKFDKDLALALSEKIEITKDDTAEQRRLKEAVIEAKNELLDLAKKGISPSKAMTEAADELYLLGQYRHDLESEIRAFKNDPTKSDDDVSLAVEAANKMPEKKGLKPLRQPNMLIRKVNLKKLKRNNNK